MKTEIEIEQKLLNILLSEDMNDVRIKNIKNVFTKVPTDEEIKQKINDIVNSYNKTIPVDCAIREEINWYKNILSLPKQPEESKTF